MIKDFNSNCLGVIYNLLIGDMRAYIQYTYITTLDKIGLGANSVKITTLYLKKKKISLKAKKNISSFVFQIRPAQPGAMF